MTSDEEGLFHSLRKGKRTKSIKKPKLHTTLGESFMSPSQLKFLTLAQFFSIIQRVDLTSTTNVVLKVQHNYYSYFNNESKPNEIWLTFITTE